MFSGYIFDVEGTLVDSVPQNLSSLQEALTKPALMYRMRYCSSTRAWMQSDTLQIIAPNLKDALRTQILHGQTQIYENKYLHTVKAFDGVQEVFETLTRRGGKLALATDCKGPELKHYLSLRRWASMNLSEQGHAVTMSNMRSRTRVS
jgi:beta-phosphoglucomutase-like phosphatase (HAD superfamily)